MEKGRVQGELVGRLSLSLRTNRDCELDQPWEETESHQDYVMVCQGGLWQQTPRSAAVSRSPVDGSGQERQREAWPLVWLGGHQTLLQPHHGRGEIHTGL